MTKPPAKPGERVTPRMTAPSPIVHLVLGPAEHGVTRHALELAAAGVSRVLHLAEPSPPTTPEVRRLLSGVAHPGTPVHAHVTDRLWGSTPEAAAELVTAIAARFRLSLTLHDLPQSSDGETGFARRAAAYRRMATTAVAVQVSSEHERLLLADIAPQVRPAVVRLPIPRRPDTPRAAATGITVGILGYLYPGKGHLEVLAALDTLERPEAELVALGRPSDGHGWLVDDLYRRAGERVVRVTGYLDDDELDRQAREITVPVAAPTHVSASGSLHRWIGCGRRPVVTASRYSRELDRSMPGLLRLTDDLPSALRYALDHPEDTWLDSTDHPWDIPAAAAAQTAAILAG